MLWRETCFLCVETEKLDKLRRPYKTFERREVFCNAKGVKRSEFYQANAQGFRPELCIELREADYAGEGHLEYRGKPYRVLRTYPVKNECIELTCTALVAEH